MLEFLRKHQYGLMLVVAILTIIAFVFLYDTNNYKSGPGAAQRGDAFSVYGEGYDSSTLRKLDGYYELASDPRELGFLELAYSLRGTKVAANGNLPLDFPINLMILRKKGRDMGVTPTDEEVKEELEAVRSFAGPDGKFSPEVYTDALEGYAKRGFQKTDLMQITRDKLTLDKVKGLLAANLVAPTTEIEDRYAEGNQEITAYALKRSLTDFEKNITITDEEIAERYEENKESLMSEEKRKIEFMRFEAPIFPKPVPPARPAPGTDLDVPSLFNSTPRPKPATTIVPTPAPEPEPVVEEPVPVPAPEPVVEEPVPAPAPEPVVEEPAPTTAEEAPAEPAEGAGDSCGAPEDEVVEDTVEEINEVVADVVEEVKETAIEVKETAIEVKDEIKDAAEAAKGSPEAVVDALKTELAAPAPVMSEDQKKAITLEFKRLVKESIDAAVESEKEVDFKKLGEDYMAKATGKIYTGEQGTTELFSAADAPVWLKTPAASRRARSALEKVFTLSEGVLSDPEKLLAGGREDWLIFRVVEIIEPKQLTLEEAKEGIVAQLKAEKADEQLQAALKKDADAIKAEMAGTKSFKESADKLEIDYARHYKYVGQPKPEELKASTFMAYKSLIDETVPGTFSDVKLAGEMGYLVYVASKELAEDENAENKKMTISDQLTDARYGYGMPLFREWLERAYKEAEPERKL